MTRYLSHLRFIQYNISFLKLAATAIASSYREYVLHDTRLHISLRLYFFIIFRIMYVSAREGHLPEALSFVNVKQVTPMPSLVLNVSHKGFPQRYPIIKIFTYPYLSDVGAGFPDDLDFIS